MPSTPRISASAAGHEDKFDVSDSMVLNLATTPGQAGMAPSVLTLSTTGH